MFTPAMTKEEIQEAARKDFLEISSKVRYAFERFTHNLRLSQNQYRSLHSLSETHTICTKARNTWTVNFRYMGYDSTGRVSLGQYIYCPLRREKSTEYIFMNVDKFFVEMLTTHFLQRYKERYLDAYHINLKGIPPALYFMIYSHGRKNTSYVIEGEEKDRELIKTDHGLILVKEGKHMRTFITFLDPNDLSNYKAKIYEEDSVLNLMKSIPKNDLKQKQAIFKKLCEDKENVERLVERFVWRNKGDRSAKEVKKNIEEMRKAWDEIVAATDHIERLMKEQEAMQAPKGKGNQRVKQLLEQLKAGALLLDKDTPAKR